MTQIIRWQRPAAGSEASQNMLAPTLHVANQQHSASSKDEPSLDELFAEPIVALLMGRDGVEAHELRAALEQVSMRLSARFKNSRALAPQSPNQRPPMWRGHLCLDPERHQCSWKGRHIDLTATEFRLLQSLIERPDFVKTRDQLMDAAYSKEMIVCDRTIDSHIKRLRRKFSAVDKEFAEIQTVWGVGYRYSKLARRKSGSKSPDNASEQTRSGKKVFGGFAKSERDGALRETDKGRD